METLIIFLNTVALYFIFAFVLNKLRKWAYHFNNSSSIEKNKKEEDQPLRIELILANSGEQLEYVLRHFISYSKIKGVPIKVCPKDQGSEDETLSILRLFRRDYPGLIQEELDKIDYKVDLKGGDR